MKIPLLKFAVAANLLLLAAATPPVQAGKDNVATRIVERQPRPEQKPIPREQVNAVGAAAFADLRREYAGRPDAENFVDRSRQYFQVNAADRTKISQNEYKPYEFRMMKSMFKELIIPHIKAQADVVASDGTAEQKAEQMSELAHGFTALRNSWAARTAQQFAPELRDAYIPGMPTAANIANDDANTNRWSREGRPGLSPEELQRRLEGSQIVKLGVESLTWAVDPKAPPLNPAPPGPGTGGGNGGTTPGGASPQNPAPPSGGDPWDQFNHNLGNAGVQGAADRAAGELLAGNYSKALKLAQGALQANPENRTAIEVYHSAKGRGGAIGAGAAALAPARFAGDGAVGRAGASADMSAFASAGAARLATAQAQNGAKSALKLDNPAGALDILNKALLKDPNNPALLNLRAHTYGRLGRWEDALRDAVAGLALAPGNMALLNTKALSENRTRRWREALATADAMIAADPRSAWGYANRAHAYAGMGLRDKMLADINYAASLDPSFAPAAAEAAALLLPSEEDVMFLFPGEPGKGGAKAPAVASPGRGRSFSVVMGAGLFGGLLLALGLLSIVLAPLKDTVVSVFTRAKRSAPRQAAVTAEPASVAGSGAASSLIRGQYEISKQIGAGGMGMVYQGTDRSLGRRVAIKKMREELRLNPRERERFIIEAKTVASLHHANIVDIYAIAEEGEDVYLVFEFVDGKTVHDLVQTAGRLPIAESVSLTRAMGEALTYAHARGVIHRDMKPSNVMRTASGQVKVMDFGIARLAKDALTRYSMTNTVVGTPPYMAPEQEQGVVRKESDVYSLAICAYEMLTGKLPFIGIGAGMLMNKINMSYIPPSRNIAGLPESIDEVFLKAFQADPDRRYRTPAEFVAALAAAADGARSKPV